MQSSRTRAVVLLLAASAAGCAVESQGDLLRRTKSTTDESDLDEASPTDDGESVLQRGPSEVDGATLVEGDILLPPGEDLQTIASAVGAAGRWPGGVIPYELAPGLKWREHFEQAIVHWESKTGIRLVQRTNEADYLRVVDDPEFGCYSYYGRLGGMQKLSLTKECSNAAAAVHEIGHAVGLWHEHTRSDRDEYVTVILENVLQGQEHNFKKTTFKSIGPYDFTSVMQYWSTAFAKEGKVALLKKDGSQIGYNTVLSEKDILGVHELYADQKLPKPGAHVPVSDDATATAPLNLRSGPATNAPIILTIPSGATVHLTGKSENGFLSVTFENNAGWAYGQYLDRNM
ncbi:MAG TPA: M12 family metallopeptidase [Labilithrix sp.]|nr:M12 family metallopeptidase [Labilithrix sp.]